MAQSTSFSDFNLPEQVLKALKNMKFETPTPIQSESIPVAQTGKDLIACAQTGSGKTAAYSIPMMSKLLSSESGGCALILVPTRELAKQISDVLRHLTAHAPNLGMAILIGGSDMRKQYMSLKRNPRIIIATPGRLMDHLRRKSLSLTKTEFLVLDEGDRMLDMGFAPQLNEILKFLPKNRQTLLFSATMPPKVRKLAESYLQNPAQITIGQESQPVETIKQSVVQTTRDKKNDTLLNELNTRTGSVIIFAATQLMTDRLADYLEDYGHKASRIHGGRSQGQRNTAIQGFRDGRFRVLVATDVASRGLDVPHIEHVINYDLPMMDEDYIHRIGRTARAGKSGEALSILLPQDRYQWMRLARKYKIKGVELTPDSRDNRGGGERSERSERGGGGGRRFGRGGGGGGGRSERPQRGERPQRSQRSPINDWYSQGGDRPERASAPVSERPPRSGRPQRDNDSRPSSRAARREVEFAPRTERASAPRGESAPRREEGRPFKRGAGTGAGKRPFRKSSERSERRAY